MTSAHDDYIRYVIGATLLGGINLMFCSFVKRNITENMGTPILSVTDGLHITSQAKAECLNNQCQYSRATMVEICLTKDRLPTERLTAFVSHN